MILGSCYMMNHHVTYAPPGETYAILQELQFALDIDFRRVTIESDANSIIMKLNNGETDHSTVGPFIRDTKQLARLFLSCKFSFIWRNGNKAAHAMIAEDLSILQRS
ncbi:hypothetical protein F3Y22_tig00110888pilonHSYRG00060 [Hibiscus syriacus]|uniref:RNase H type-1 domain-containing protein n=1 Tax=Hibiscus syriacus TaxID=106335 RepID=A0A6A2ZJY0_HIBSY|nr:hypothetical protein F3Y22_tig00110888pilonHSYRG00060 [Hibiscus syriacus]